MITLHCIVTQELISNGHFTFLLKRYAFHIQHIYIYISIVINLIFRLILSCHRKTVYLLMFCSLSIMLSVVLLNTLLVSFDQVRKFSFGNLQLIRSLFFLITDFLPAVSNMTPITPSDSTTMSSTNTRSPIFLSINEGNSEEMARLHQLYLKLIHANRE